MIKKSTTYLLAPTSHTALKVRSVIAVKSFLSLDFETFWSIILRYSYTFTINREYSLKVLATLFFGTLSQSTTAFRHQTISTDTFRFYCKRGTIMSVFFDTAFSIYWRRMRFLSIFSFTAKSLFWPENSGENLTLRTNNTLVMDINDTFELLFK